MKHLVEDESIGYMDNESEMFPICAYPLTAREEISFKAFYKTFYDYDWHNVEIYIYPKCES